MVPGVHVREVNGKGQYTVVTVRGSTAAQVGVFVDGVMTNLGGDAAVDISTIPVKNVERIEVYRGYIPARFGGTFIGGVINVVTKKPTKANISAELGKASFGGKSASLEVVSPLASGSLLVGLNYEAAKGDFPYHNYSYDDPRNQKEMQRVLDEYPNEIESMENSLTLDNWNKNKIEDLYKGGDISENVRNQYIDSAGKVDNEGWLGYVRNGGLINSYIEMNTQKAKDELRDTYSKWDNSFADENLKSSATDYYYNSDELFKYRYDEYTKDMEDLQSRIDSGEFKTERQIRRAKRAIQEDKEMQANLVLKKLQDSWDNKTGYFEDSHFATEKKQVSKLVEDKLATDPEYKDKLSQKIDEIKSEAESKANVLKETVDPETSGEYELKKNILDSDKRTLENYKRMEKEKAERHRKYNDRKNISSLIKWQNDNWMVKASYNHINRHLPDSLWGMEQVASEGWNTGVATDVYDHFFADSRKQTMDTYDLMLQNRQQHGRLEWGWFVDYQHQKKKYNAEHKLYYPWDENGNEIPELSASSEAATWKNSVLRGWSQYNSNKYNLQMDGSYKLSERQILEFQANYSYEKMNIDGHNMYRALNTKELWEWLAPTWRVRNRYEQKILNIQLQDTITLDKKASWFLTPSWRFNSSTIVGYSDSKNFRDNPDNSANAIKWFHPRDSQRDRKGTWQLALKKNVNDNLTFRMTGGTYYRLLNMYEIAGDGAGILPMPHKGWDTAAFPQPEYGKQFDFSTLWNGKFGKSDAYVTLTYFWRDTQRMLQLRRMAKDFFCYTNDSKGKVHGFELQSGLKWDHFSVDLEATYTNTHAMAKTDKNIPGGDDVWYESRATYQPEWEGNVRLSWFPSPKFTLFSEAHYIGKFYTYTLHGIASKSKFDLGCPTPSTTVVNAGIKLQPNKAWQFTLGCNDIFNQNPKQKILIGDDVYINPACPLQGRTYYATIHYEF